MIRKAISLISLGTAIVLVTMAGLDSYGREKEKHVYETIRETYVKVRTGPDVESLKSVNPDTVAFLEVGEIALPVVKSRDNDEYLKKDFYGEDSKSGCLFISMLNSSDLTDANTVIYGHNMKNGTMFGSLKRFLNEDYFNEYEKIRIYTEDDEYLYRIVGVGKVRDGTETYLPNPGGEGGIREYLSNIYSKYNIKREYNIMEQHHVLTLSTCTGSEDIRLIVQAILEEKIER